MKETFKETYNFLDNTRFDVMACFLWIGLALLYLFVCYVIFPSASYLINNVILIAFFIVPFLPVLPVIILLLLFLIGYQLLVIGIGYLIQGYKSDNKKQKVKALNLLFLVAIPSIISAVILYLIVF